MLLRHIDVVAQIVFHDTGYLGFLLLKLHVLQGNGISGLKAKDVFCALCDQHTIVFWIQNLSFRAFQTNIILYGTIIGKSHQLHLFGFSLGIDELHAVNPQLHIIPDIFVRCQMAGHFILILFVKNSHQIILINPVVLFRTQIGNGILNGKAADQQGGTAHDSSHCHKQALFISEQIAKGHLVQKLQTAPEGGDMLQKYAGTCTGCLGAQKSRRHMFQLTMAGQGSGTYNGCHKQQYPADTIKKIKLQIIMRNRIKLFQNHRYEFGQQDKAADISHNAAQQAGTKSKQEIFPVNGASSKAQCLVGSDHTPFFFHHPGHRGQAHENCHEQEDSRKEMAHSFNGG